VNTFRTRIGNVLLFVSFLTLCGAALAGEITVTFIGNEAFHITDGETTLLSDFPYTSGAYGYMAFDVDEIPDVVDGLSLITHFHTDHFDPEAFKATDFSIVAPVSITEKLGVGERVVTLRPPTAPPSGDTKVGPRVARVAQYKDIRIEMFITPHRFAPDHYSYLVTWHGKRFYFVGDTESPAALLPMKNLDVAFVTPWLIRTMARQGLAINAERIVLYHHKTSENVPPFQDYVRLDQGAPFTVGYGEDDARGGAPVEQRGFSIVIETPSPNPEDLIETIMALRPDLDRDEATELQKHLPAILSAGLPRARAEEALVRVLATQSRAHLD